MLIFAAEGLRQCIACLRTWKPRRSGALLLCLAAAFALVHTGVNPSELDPVRSAWLQGHVYMRNGEYGRAEQAFLQALATSGEDADILNSLGPTRQRLGREGEAETAYLRALALAPDFARPRLNLGRLYLKQGRLTVAEAALESALESDPHPATQYEGRYHLGVVYRHAGRETEARTAFAAAEGLRRSAGLP
ncbi:MAG: tetratricopeptide repeat protein [Candidatus Latescibacteria bacterium]|nr:tetratricopeptide repeat protein [Candidatus Latescibacterota bacterium]